MNRELLERGLNDLEIDFSEEQLDQFAEYSELLKEWNKKINLTAITDDDGIAVKHFLDCALPLRYVDFKEGAKIADIGTGAGFPGLPIKILRQDMSLTLLDSLNKRINFLNEVKRELGLRQVECIHARAEELSLDRAYRDKYDYVVSRAVAGMGMLCEYCLPYVKPGGYFVALKADNSEAEIEEAKPMIGNLGGTVEEIIKAPLPRTDIVRTLAVIKKLSPTPKAFPRSQKKIKQANKKI